MRAILQRDFGGPDVLELGDVDRPQPLPTEVLVRVEAAGINPVDLKTRVGKGMADVLGDPPFVPGWDVAGVVEETGFGVTTLAPGDRVLGMPWFPRAAGAYAECVTAPSRHFVRCPASLQVDGAAGLPLAGLTAWQVLHDTAGLAEGQRVLIHAGSGGVGHLAVQIARACGAHVISTGSGPSRDFVLGLGADEFVDYREEDFTERIDEPIDLVVDLVGGDEHGRRSLQVLAPDGLLVAVPSGVSDELIAAAEEQGKRATGFLVEPDHAGLRSLVGLVEQGELRVEVGASFPLERAADAHRRLEEGGVRGKVVLTV
jgi:NADPH:quinone reductase-like Zn-dependent oxidoreductase